jgi:transcription-repair coupling factor (superfamily II helicase)
MSINCHHNLWGAAKSHFLKKSLENKQNLLIICENSEIAFKTLNELKLFLPEKQILNFPEYTQEPFENARILPEIMAERAKCLHSLIQSDSNIVVTTLYSLIKTLPKPEKFKSCILEIQKGNNFERDELLYFLDTLGYIQVEIVSGPGEFSFRGDITDIFPVQNKNPIRMEFFDDEIERIYEYKLETQLKTFEINEFFLLPASELLTDLNELISKTESLKVKENLETFGKFAGYHWYPPEELKNTSSLFDYFPIVPEIYIFSDNLRYRAEQIQIRIEDALQNTDIPVNIEANFINPINMFKSITAKSHYFFKEITNEECKGENYGSSKTILHKPSKNIYESLSIFYESIKPYIANEFRIIIATSSSKFKKLISDFVKDYRLNLIEIFKEPEKKGLYLFPKSITSGFINKKDKLLVICDNEIFGFSKKTVKKRKKDVFKTALSDLSADDFIVHIDYGIGKFKGLVHKSIGGINGDFIEIEYSDGEILYVPVENINHIQKYIGSQGSEPSLNSLQNQKWLKLKKQAAKNAKKLAMDILKLYAERKKIKGFSLKGDDLFVKHIENTFEYEETQDQMTAIYDVFKDMEQATPMERLICGDVGFGKTEIAVRAAAKAVSNGKQVAILVPTTVLARQHFETFTKRFENLPVKIEVVSRLKTTSEIKKILKETENGKIDILIGTHRLLSNDVIFNDLGLLIIDEEQRFGVSHKEKIKTLRSNIDVLSMSATPIPRTLQMSLSGIRDISTIETPPENRLPVLTKIIKDDEQISSAIKQELKRGGQVYFLHNNVKDIENVASYVKNLVPFSKVRIAHGQMTSNQLEKVLVDFYSNEIDILVCTTIIENGLDIPNANTIIINNAHKFGLSQLYQIKGRVGRANKRGHCYLIVKSFEKLTPLAQKRLKIIQQLSDLGSGFKIATYDLQLRGAGTLLGAEQSGLAVQIGYELYNQLIEQAINELKGCKATEETEINSNIPYFLPADYVKNTNERMNLYNMVSEIFTKEDEKKFIKYLEENFGEIPIPTENLIKIMRLKNICEKLNVKKLTILSTSIKLIFSKQAQIDPLFLLNEAKNISSVLLFKNDYELQFTSQSGNVLRNSIDFFEKISNSMQYLNISDQNNEN